MAALSALGVRPVGLGTMRTRGSAAAQPVGDLLGAVLGGPEREDDLERARVVLGEDLADGLAQVPLLVEDRHDDADGRQPRRPGVGWLGRGEGAVHNAQVSTIGSGNEDNVPTPGCRGTPSRQPRRLVGCRGRVEYHRPVTRPSNDVPCSRTAGAPRR